MHWSAPLARHYARPTSTQIGPSPHLTGWKSFWNRGGWWRALILATVYYAVYQGIAVFIVGPLFGRIWGTAGSAEYIF